MTKSRESEWIIFAVCSIALTAFGVYWATKPMTEVVSAKCYDGQLWTTYWKKGRHKGKLILVDDKPVQCKEQP